MKRIRGILIAALLLLSTGIEAQADDETAASTLSVMTYNLKFASSSHPGRSGARCRWT